MSFFLPSSLRYMHKIIEAFNSIVVECCRDVPTQVFFKDIKTYNVSHKMK